VTVKIDWPATKHTQWSACGDYVVGVFAKRCGLTAGDVQAQARARGVVVIIGCIVVCGHEFVDLYHHAIVARVVGNADRAHHKVDFNGRGDLHCVFEWTLVNIGRVLEQLAHVLTECSNLLLFTLHSDAFAIGAHVNNKRASAGLTEGTAGKGIGGRELLVHHDGRSSARLPPVEFTVSTTGPASEYDTALTEHVLMTMR